MEIVLTYIASGYLAISVPFLAATLYFLHRFYLRTSRQVRALDLELKAPLFSHFIASTEGLVTIRAFSWTSTVELQNTKLLDMSQRPHYLLFCLQRWLTLVLDLTIAAMATLLMGLAVALRDTINPGNLGVALVSIMGLGNTLSALLTYWTNLETSLQAVCRLQDFTKGTPIEYEENDVSLQGRNVNLDKWLSRGDVILSNVSASYGSTNVLHDIDIIFAAGSKTTVCGRTVSRREILHQAPKIQHISKIPHW
jgi:ATP-binding cassette subfamily C (CFTR/MRP) protein 1